jgi:hypothetical protein
MTCLPLCLSCPPHRTSSRYKSSLRILGVPRGVFAGALALLAVYLWHTGHGWLVWSIATLLGGHTSSKMQCSSRGSSWRTSRSSSTAADTVTSSVQPSESCLIPVKEHVLCLTVCCLGCRSGPASGACQLQVPQPQGPLGEREGRI